MHGRAASLLFVHHIFDFIAYNLCGVFAAAIIRGRCRLVLMPTHAIDYLSEV